MRSFSQAVTGEEVMTSGAITVQSARGSLSALSKPAIVTRFLIGRIVADRLRKVLLASWFVALVGLIVLAVGQAFAGLVVVALGVLGVVARALTPRILERLLLASQFRPVAEELVTAVEGGKPNMRRELRRVGLPASGLGMPLLAWRLARSGRGSESFRRLAQVRLDRVLPLIQIERALQLLGEAR